MEENTEVERPEPSQPTFTGGVGTKRAERTQTERSSTSGLPPKPKKFAKRAEVWKHFIQREDDPKKCNCKYCNALIGCDSKTAGTSPMISHISRCKVFKNFEEKEKQKLIGSDSAGNMKMIKYDPQNFRRSLNEMVVVNELAFSFVESEGWKRFCLNVLPMYQSFSRRTCTRDIVAMYLEEKEALRTMFKTEKQRVSLTTDIWTSPTTSYNYMVVTGHWIDINWKLQKRILSFKVITDHKGETIAGQLVDCLEDWGIEKVFTVTVDNAKNNDKALRIFRDHMVSLGSERLVLGGDLLHMRCCAHILNLIVGDGLKKSKASIDAVRNALKYVRSSGTRLKSFQLRCESGKISRGSLPLDVITRWNSTYLMLTSSLKFRGAFEKMEAEDKLYCDYFLDEDEDKVKRLGPPGPFDWDEVQRLVKFLKIFYKCTVTFSASKSVTSTLCYNELVNIERNLISKCGNSNVEIRKQAHVMRDKFEKYWDGLMNMNPLVIIGSVFDPRNKMQFASLCFDQLYGKDTIDSRKLRSLVSNVLKRMYEEYAGRLAKPVHECQTSAGDSEMRDVSMFEEDDDDDDDYEGADSIYKQMMQINRTEDGCSELDIYLAEKTEIRVDNPLGLEYDVLSWWKCNASKFPVLSELARDVLAIQVSSVASESAFSTIGRVLDPYRSSLTPYMVEVLLCTQQWLRSSHKVQTEVGNLAQMLEEVEFFDSLDALNSPSSEPLGTQSSDQVI